MGRMQRDKGARGERELAEVLSRKFNIEAFRTAQRTGIHGDDDVEFLPRLFVECKRVERLNVPAAMATAVEQCPEGRYPVLFHRPNRHPWMVTCLLADWPEVSEVIHLTKYQG